MRRFQFSLLGLIGLMTFTAVGCAASNNTYTGSTTISSGSTWITLAGLNPETASYFKITGNLLFVMLCALIGGFFVRAFYHTQS